jgi:hypothetical protein
MDKKNCSHKQKKDLIDNLFEQKNDKVVIDIEKLTNSNIINSLPLPTTTIPSNTLHTNSTLTYSLPKLTPLPPISTEPKQEIKVELPKTELKAETKVEKVETVKQDNKKTDDNIITSLMINPTRDNFSNITIEEIHLNFKTLSRIKEHDKMYLRDCKFLEVDDSYLQMVSRTVKNAMWNGYNREDVIDFLIHLTDQTIKTCDALSYSLKSSYEGKENTKSTLTNLIIDMEQALMGLQKLKITYYNDNAILTRLDMIMDKFDKKIREMKDYLLKN